jgi:hypothetical protein
MMTRREREREWQGLAAGVIYWMVAELRFCYVLDLLVGASTTVDVALLLPHFSSDISHPIMVKHAMERTDRS